MKKKKKKFSTFYTQIAAVQLTPGILDVTLIEVSRLNIDPNLVGAKKLSQIEIYCTVSIDATPWVALTLYNDITYMVLDLIVSKTNSQQLGVVFKQEFIQEIGQNCVIVETIVCNSPAAIAELRKGDVIMAVNGKKVTNMSQIAKLIKSAAQRRFIIRVERKYTNADRSTMRIDVDKSTEKTLNKKSSKSDISAIKNEQISVDDNFKSIKFSDLKDVDSDVVDKSDSGSKLFRRRKSNSTSTVEESQQAPDTPSKRFSNPTGTSNTHTNMSTSAISDISTPTVHLNELVYTSKEKKLTTLMSFEERISFLVESEFHFLNIGVWAKHMDGETPSRLVGYINAPVNLILAQCSTSSTGHYLKCHALLPPDSGIAKICSSHINFLISMKYLYYFFFL